MHRRDALVLGATGALAMTIGEAVARTPDDLTGKGHITRTVGNEDRIAIVIPVADGK